ncbi:MAG: FKBP-type peptidyl-prolyl cis-trans isomerase, partial [Eubacteriales bacterium]|nr:FKBP-type peptidyl-prolyl cis-trans isomerase [Eubacteriales bacterium]
TEAAETTTAAAETQAAQSADLINAMVAALDVTEPENLGVINKLGEYKGIAFTAPEHVVITAEEAREFIETNELPNYTEEVDVIADGDTANIDYEGKKDGVAFDGGSATNYSLVIGSGTFIDGFESGLIGKKKGETVELNLTFPETYGNADLAGKAVVFTVKINSITRVKKLDDSVAKEIAEKFSLAASTVDEVIEQYRIELQRTNDLDEKQELYYNAVNAVLANTDATPSDEALDFTTNTYLKNYAAKCQNNYGISLGDLLSLYGETFESLKASFSIYSEETVRQRLILEAIAKAENLKVTDADIEAFAADYGYTVEGIKELMGETQLNQLVLEDLASQFIVDNATITYEKAE